MLLAVGYQAHSTLRYAGAGHLDKQLLLRHILQEFRGEGGEALGNGDVCYLLLLFLLIILIRWCWPI